MGAGGLGERTHLKRGRANETGEFSGPLKRESLARRIRVYFVIISGLSLVALVIAFYGFRVVENYQLDVLGSMLPRLEQSQELGLVSRELLALSGAITDTHTHTSLERNLSALREKRARIERIAAAARSDADTPVEVILAKGNEITANSLGLGALVGRLIELDERARTEFKRARTDAGRLADLFETGSVRIASELSIKAQEVENLGLRDELGLRGLTDAFGPLLETGPARIESLIEGRFRAERLVQFFVDPSEFTDGARIDQNARAAHLEMRRTILLAVAFDEPVQRRQAALYFGTLEKALFGPRNVFETGHERLALVAQMTELDLANAQLASEIDRLINELVGGAQQLAQDAASEAQQALSAGRLGLGTLVAVIIGLSALLTFRLVANVINRLNLLTDDALSLAGGDLDVEIDVSGRDELSRLALSLRKFQNNARLLEEQRIELQRSNHELEQFAYVASHDLQEPLRMVSGYCDLLERRYADRLDKDGRDFLQFAVEGAQRMRGLLSDLLSYSRIGRTVVERGRVDLDAVVQDVQHDLRDFINERGASVRIGSLGYVSGNASLLHRLLLNLIQNAVKFSADQAPVVDVTARNEQSTVQVSVADNGIGIDDKFRDRIFEVFQRLHTREAFQGNGIGLSVAQRIVDLHKGSIWFEPNRPRGTVFHITLQAAD